MSSIFRKSLLDKLSSPEQLDKMIVITPPAFWVALSGAGLIIVTALLWSVFGRLPTDVDAQGIYMYGKGIHTTYAKTTGVVEKIVASEGTVVKPGDPIAYLDATDVREKLVNCRKRINIVKAVTMDSQDDVVTSDNQSLMDIKNQLLSLDQTLEQNQALLDMRTKELSQQRQRVTTAQQEMLAAETSYYNSLNVGDSTAEQIAYSDAQSAYANASAALETANANLEQVKSGLADAEEAYKEAENYYNALTAQQGDSDEIAATVDPAEIAAAENALNDAYNAVVSAEDSLQRIRRSASNAASKKDNTKAAYDSAKAVYESKMGSISQAQAIQGQQSNAYNVAMNAYNTAKSAETSLEDAVIQLEVQVDSDKKSLEKQTESLNRQFDAAKGSILDQLSKEYGQYEQELSDYTVVATLSGEITETTLYQGGAVNAGSGVAKIRLGEAADSQLVCYVPLASGKKIAQGMKVLVYPTTVNQQEYGHMEATVVGVDEYVTSPEKLMTQLGDDNLSQMFLQEGPVVAVTCDLRKDEATASGYYWSSKKGASITLSTSTLMDVSVVVAEKRPIDLLMPFLKEKLTVQSDPEKGK
jgi:NHLM bacteriocin system secretion protein